MFKILVLLRNAHGVIVETMVVDSEEEKDVVPKTTGWVTAEVRAVVTNVTECNEKCNF